MHACKLRLVHELLVGLLALIEPLVIYIYGFSEAVEFGRVPLPADSANGFNHGDLLVEEAPDAALVVAKGALELRLHLHRLLRRGRLSPRH